MKLSALAAALASLALIAPQASTAQTPAPPPPPSPLLPSLDAVPEKMPFDIPYGPPITLEQAKAVIAGGIAECARRGWKMNLAVMDSGANLVAFERMDGAQLASGEIAQHKAKTAVLFRRDTKVFETNVTNGMVYQFTLDGMIASRGGIPLVQGGKLIGAVGSSGGAGGQDEVCAKAAAAVINK